MNISQCINISLPILPVMTKSGSAKRAPARTPHRTIAMGLWPVILMVIKLRTLNHRMPTGDTVPPISQMYPSHFICN